jgi:lipopolysaccharide/colanic/teichoic acid biosynthesis glycosyltransferase
MELRHWEAIPDFMKNENVREYYILLKDRRLSLYAKRGLDMVASLILLVILSPIMVIIGIMIKWGSDGPVMFRQIRITQYGREFKIYKFRTMVNNADKIGSQVTLQNDLRVTRVGKLLRGCRLDEIPQLINILTGDMTFVGTRPEVLKYVKQYTPEMLATLLLPAGVTSEASIHYKDEDQLLQSAENADKMYVNQVLPEKMKYNLRYLKEFGLFNDIRIMLRTVLAVIR